MIKISKARLKIREFINMIKYGLDESDNHAPDDVESWKLSSECPNQG